MLFRAFVILFLALIGAGFASVAGAQTRQVVVPAAEGGEIEIGTLELRDGLPARAINLPAGKARLIRLPMEVRDVLVANPAVANVVVKTQRLIYLVGLEVGSTNAFFLNKNMPGF